MSLQNSHQISDVKVMLKQGKDGNGIESIEKTGTSGNVDTYTITFTDGTKTTYTVTNGESGGIYPHIIVISESGSTVTLTKGSTVITASETSTGHFEADVTEFGTWTIDAILGGDDAQVSLYVDTVKIYTVDDSHFHSDITVEYPSGATCNLAGQGESYYATGSPYTFTVHHAGAYDITVVYEGQTYTDSVTVTTTGEIISKKVPSPSSAPANDIDWWLWFGGVSGSYSSLSDILADSTALSTLMASTDAVDYLVRCKEWIGNGLVPIMTSNTTPSGECFASTSQTNTPAYKAFDDNTTSYWGASSRVNQYVGYKFASSTVVRHVKFVSDYGTMMRVKNFKIQASNDNSTWVDLYTGVYPNTQGYKFSADLNNNTAYLYYRIYVVDNYDSSENYYIRIDEIQFYSLIQGITDNQSAMSYIGLNNYCANTLLADSDWLDGIANSTYFESVLNVKVPTMTSNTTPSGVASANATLSPNQPYYAFDKDNSTVWLSTTGTTNNYIRYQFLSNITPKKVVIVFKCNINGASYIVKIQGSNDGINFEEIGSTTLNSDGTYNATTQNVILDNSTSYKYVELFISSSMLDAQSNNISIAELQFYGRADV